MSSAATIPTILKYRLLHAGGLNAGGAGGAPAGGEKKEKADKKEKKGDAEAKEGEAPKKGGGNARKAAAIAAMAQAGERKTQTVAHPLGEALFGDLERVQSAYNTERKWADIATLTEASVGQEVWVRARVHKSNTKGKTTFIALRRGFSSIQCVVERGTPEQKDKVTPEFQKFVEKINPESVVDVLAVVGKAFKPVTSCSQSAVELKPSRFYVVSSSANVLPFQLEDAARPPGKHGEEKKAEEKDVVTVGTDLRLDNRVIDLRTPANHAIFRLQSRVCEFYRAYFVSEGFVEIHTPKITPGVSEGGSDVFKLDYFGEKACLAQSPQLFKQMAVMSDLFKVFEIGHVFRAENSNTHRHMCEFVGLDFEMEIKESYRECTKVLGDCFNFIFDKINTHCQAELAAIQKQYPFEPLRYSKETLVLDFKEAMKMLRESGETIGDMDDFSTTQEKKLGKLVAAKYNTDFYIIDQYPITVRPFYTMPNKTNPEYTNSYDVFVRGEEITSGAQRVHEVELLKERATAKGVPHDNITAYLEAFKFGAYPHGGAGIGLERVVMLFLGLDNIRKTSMFPRTPTRLSP